jgi:adenylate kinase
VRGIVGICGTPGTGKKTVAPMVATLLGLAPATSLNSLAPRGVVEVDPRVLRRELLKLSPPARVIFGHLLPHVLRKSEAGFVAVLRCEPLILRDRLAERGYPAAKVIENVEAELIGVVLDECVRRFGGDLVREYETTSASPKEVAKAIARDAKAAMARSGRAARRKAPAWIDWTLDYGSSSKLRSLFDGRRDPTAST